MGDQVDADADAAGGRNSTSSVHQDLSICHCLSVCGLSDCFWARRPRLLCLGAPIRRQTVRTEEIPGVMWAFEQVRDGVLLGLLPYDYLFSS